MYNLLCFQNKTVLNFQSLFSCKSVSFKCICRYQRSIFYKMVPNIVVDLSAILLLTVDELEQVQRQRIASLIGHVIQPTLAAMIDLLI